MTDFNFERDRSDPQIYWRNSRIEEDDRFRSEEEKRTAQLQKEIDNKLLPSEIRDKVRYGGNSLPIMMRIDLPTHPSTYLLVGI